MAPKPKLICFDQALKASFRLKPRDDVEEEGELSTSSSESGSNCSAEEVETKPRQNQHGITLGPAGDDINQNDNDDEQQDNKLADKEEHNNNGTGDETKAEGESEVSKPITKVRQKPFISLFEMQSFLIALILPEPRLSNPPSWCRVQRCLRASNVGIFLLDDVDLDWIEDKAAKFSNSFRCETSPDWIERLTMVPLSRRAQNMTAKSEAKRNEKKFETNLNARPKIGRSSLLLSPVQMISENYPMPYNEGLKPSRSKYYRVTEDSPMFGVDCEMCITDNGSELTKISIVDEESRVVYNQLVKPDLPIINYLTRYSGITKEMMEHVDNTLEDVQYFMRKKLPRDAIFVGHSLNMDLVALRIFHPYVIDTSVIYNRSGERYYKPSLKTLAYEFLGKSIQTTDKLGHDSLEDAVTALELVQLKIVNGLEFGDEVAFERAMGLKYDSKTGVSQMQLDKFIARHDVVPISYRKLDLTPGARCVYIHDKQGPLEQEVKDAILQLLDKPFSICCIVTNSGQCYVNI